MTALTSASAWPLSISIADASSPASVTLDVGFQELAEKLSNAWIMLAAAMGKAPTPPAEAVAKGFCRLRMMPITATASVSAASAVDVDVLTVARGGAPITLTLEATGYGDTDLAYVRSFGTGAAVTLEVEGLAPIALGTSGDTLHVFRFAGSSWTHLA